MRNIFVLITFLVGFIEPVSGQHYIMRHGHKVYRTSIGFGNDGIDDTWNDAGFKLPRHSPLDFGVIGTEIPGKFSATEALFKLFPGRHFYLTDEDDAKRYYSAAVWMSPKMPRHWVKSEGIDHWFPGKEGNFTKVYKAVPFKNDSGRQFVYVIFEHNPRTSMGALYVGAGCGADMGLALFAQQKEKWVLTHFSIYAGSSGNYTRLTAEPSIKKLGNNNYALELFSPVNGPGGPSSGESYLYAPMGHSINLVYSSQPSAVWDFNGRCSQWSSKLQPMPGNASFNDLNVIISGDYCLPSMAGGIYEDDTIGYTPQEVFFKTSYADSFGYKITKLYHFDGKKYRWQHTFFKTFAVKLKKR
jgi:hypothetical protein